MTPLAVLSLVAAYFGLLLWIAKGTSRNSNAQSYYLGNRQSPWWVIAFGVIGDTLSGVTFLSVPGKVSQAGFTYLQVVWGYVLGYLVIAQILLPVYYRLNLTSIYEYLGTRFGTGAQKTGASFFLLSRSLGAAARLYLAVVVFQEFVFEPLGVTFPVTTGAIILLMLAYTLRGGIKTLIWTDLMQSGFLLAALVISLTVLGIQWVNGGFGLHDSWVELRKHAWINTNFQSADFFWKQVLSGAAIAVVMTGLDQNQMQKSLSCRSLSDAQKNVYVFIPILVLVNFLFLLLGAGLSAIAQQKGLPPIVRTDLLFPTMALHHLGGVAALVFVLGLTAATYNSADSVLTTLTTSFCLDWLKLESRTDWEDRKKQGIRRGIHFGFAMILFATIMGFRALNNGAVIDAVLKLAGYTYGPLLGLFVTGMLTQWKPRSSWVPAVCMISPLLTWWIERNSKAWLGGYQIGFELLLLNGALTTFGLFLISRKKQWGRFYILDTDLRTRSANLLSAGESEIKSRIQIRPH